MLVPAASATIAPGALNCPLSPFNPTKYGLQTSPTQQTVTCTIDGASDVSGLSTVTVYIKSSNTGNTTVTGTVTGTGSATKITFTFTAPSGGCNTVVVAYGSPGNNTTSTLIGGNTAAAGFAYLDASGNVITVCGSPPPPPPAPKIYLGYADSYTTHGTPDGLPWTGLSPAPVILGCGVDPNGGAAIADNCPTDTATGADLYDAGAIMIVNPGTTPITVTNSYVDIGACHYTPWANLNMSIPGGGSLVLTQTGGPHPLCNGGNINGNYNFDTTESAPFGSSCSGPNDGLIPVVSLTINGTLTTITDSGQILNHGGVDVGDYPCFNSELEPFVQVSP